jgi:hypothetical protein
MVNPAPNSRANLLAVVQFSVHNRAFRIEEPSMNALTVPDIWRIPKASDLLRMAVPRPICRSRGVCCPSHLRDRCLVSNLGEMVHNLVQTP